MGVPRVGVASGGWCFATVVILSPWWSFRAQSRNPESTVEQLGSLGPATSRRVTGKGRGVTRGRGVCHEGTGRLSPALFLPLPSPCGAERLTTIFVTLRSGATRTGPDYLVVRPWFLDSAIRSAPQNDRGRAFGTPRERLMAE